MALVLFLIDTSPSMNQKASNEMTFLDIAKSTVERILQLRNGRDKYFLVTFADGMDAIKSSWSDLKNRNTFSYELKNLQAMDLDNLDSALQKSFDLLNMKRVRNGIDNYGGGRRMNLIEPADIIFITDGTRLTDSHSPNDFIRIPEVTERPGSELQKDLYRWDQRIFSVILAMNGIHMKLENMEIVEPYTGKPIFNLCEETGGTAFVVHNMKQLSHTIDVLSNGKLQQIGVIAEFVPLGNINVPPCKKMIYPNPFKVEWPFPDDYFYHREMNQLLPRKGHPTIMYAVKEFQFPVEIPDDFPVDRYRLETSECTKFVINNTKNNGYFLVFMEMANVQKSEMKSFGFLKADISTGHVYLLVLPYNFGPFLKLMKKYKGFFQAKKQATMKFKNELVSYFQSVPMYYVPQLKSLIQKTFVSFIDIPVNQEMDTSLMIYLQHIKKLAADEDDKFETQYAKLKKIRSKSKNQEDPNKMDIDEDEREIEIETLPTNVFDIERENLLDQINTLKKKYVYNRSTISTKIDRKHSLPIADMGNYLNVPTDVLREVIPTKPKHNFGNPYMKKAKGKMMKNLFSVDEAFDLSIQEIHSQDNSEKSNIRRKREAPAPISRDKPLKKTSPEAPTTNGRAKLEPPTKKIEKLEWPQSQKVISKNNKLLFQAYQLIRKPKTNPSDFDHIISSIVPTETLKTSYYIQKTIEMAQNYKNRELISHLTSVLSQLESEQ